MLDSAARIAERKRIIAAVTVRVRVTAANADRVLTQEAPGNAVVETRPIVINASGDREPSRELERTGCARDGPGAEWFVEFAAYHSPGHIGDRRLAQHLVNQRENGSGVLSVENRYNVVPAASVENRDCAACAFSGRYRGNIVDVIEDEALVERSATLGEYALERGRDLATRFDVIGDVRGRGLLLGLELVHDDSARSPDASRAEKVMYAALGHGLSFKTTMGNVLTLTPPLTISDVELERAFDILEAAFVA